MALRPYPRSRRVAELLLEEISWLIRRELKEPRIGFVTLTHVDVSKDLRYAKVFASIMGEEAERTKSIEGLRNSSGFIRMRLKENLRLRIIPEITFVLDTTLEKVQRINELIRDIQE